MTSKLQEAWEKACEIRAEAHKLWVEGNNLNVKGRKLTAEADKLWAEGQLVFNEAVIEAYGKDAIIQWTYKGAIVNGEEFTEVRDEG